MTSSSQVFQDVDSGICTVKSEVDDAEELMEPHFVSIKVEPDFEQQSEESVEGENLKASEGTEDLSKESKQRPHTDDCTLPYWSSETDPCPSETLSESVEINTENQFRKTSSSSERSSVLGPSLTSQKQFGVASCSTEEEEQQDAADTYFLKEHAELGQKHLSDQREESNSAHLEEPHCQRNALQSDSLISSTGEKSFKCSQCGKAFERRNDLNRHVLTHTGSRPYKCAQCGKSFSQSHYLSKHMRKHTGDKPFKCSLCGICFSENGHLTVHMRKHSGDRPFSCSLCGKCFRHSCTLTRHMRVHTGEKPYRCSQCGQSFIDTDTLTKHMRTHSGDRPYKCSHCGKSFAQSSTLTNHMRQHTGQKPFQCPQCGKSFTRNCSLIEHMCIHTGELPFACTVCGECFKTSSHLSYHKRRFHAAASCTS